MKVNYSVSNIIKVPLIVLSFYFLLPVTILAQKEVRKTTRTTRYNTKKTFYGQASFYANKFNGRRTASGEIFYQKKNSYKKPKYTLILHT